MNAYPDDPRQSAILGAAWQCFAAYGFRKTSMDDIARAAGMSRPALYQHYRNKEDVFRRLAQHYYDRAADALANALAMPGPADEVLTRAFAAQGGEIIEAMLSSPHGLELLDTSRAAASDIAEAGEARFHGLYGTWLETERDAGRIGFAGSASNVAATITAALKGLKSAAPAYDNYSASLAQLARLIGRGLSADAKTPENGQCRHGESDRSASSDTA